MSYPGIVGEDLCFAPSLGHQTDDEFDREPRPADDGLAALSSAARSAVWCRLPPNLPPAELTRNFAAAIGKHDGGRGTFLGRKGSPQVG